MQQTVLCIDVGTTSLKAAYIDHKGKLYAFSRQPFSLIADRAKEWLPALQRAVKQLNSSLQNVKKNIIPSAVCISGNGPTIVSDTGKTLLWNAPVNTNKNLPKKAESSLFLPRIIAFNEKFKSEWDNSQYIFSGPEFLIWTLTGNAITILPEKRYENAYWTEESLHDCISETEKIPHFVSPAYNAGPIKSDIAKLLDLPESIPIFCGAPDFIAAMIGTNALSENKLYDCAGSSEGINLCTSHPVSFSQILTLPSVIPDLWNEAFLITDSGIKFAEYKISQEKKKGTTISYEQLVQNALTGKDTQGSIILNEIALNVKKGIDSLKQAGIVNHLCWPEYMITTGGQVQNKQWLQMKTNITRMPTAVTENPNAELTGDAVMAMTGLGIYTDIQTAANHMIHIIKIYYPE